MQNKKNNWIFLVLFFLSTTFAHAIDVTGRVVDELGETLIGVTVQVEETKTGTVTDYDGIYNLSVTDSQARLVFSYIGMETQTVSLNGRSTLNVTMQTASHQLQEVVAVGYGTMRRKDLTGSVSSLNAKELESVPVSSVSEALAGRIAGVNVTSSEGGLGAEISIRVRGGISLTQSNEPLYIIDGFPSESTEFSSLNASDIESIDVLKDASSTAIYGARGANGVIVVTTKSGAAGKTDISYEGYIGVRTMSNKLDMLSTDEFVFLDYERRNGESSAIKSWEEYYGSFDEISNFAGTGVNWQDEAFQDAMTQSHRVSISGGEKNLRYTLSYTHQAEDGLMVYSDMVKDNLRFKIDHRVNSRLRVGANANYTSQKVSAMGTSEGSGNFGKMSSILMYTPTLGNLASDEQLLTDPEINNLVEDDDGNTMQNPVVSAQYETNDKELRIFSAGANAELEIFKNFKFKNTTGMLYRTQRTDIFYGSQSMTAKRTSINGSIQYADQGRFQTSNVLSYDWKKRAHKLNVMVGQEYVENWNRYIKMSATNFPNDDIGLADMSLGLAGTNQSYENDDDTVLSFFTRAYYNFSEKYMLTATARYDGSSKFGSGNKWGFFPSASFAWRASEEDFIKDLGVFSDLKVRAGYGTSGNNGIPSYSSLAVWSSVNAPTGSTVTPGYYPSAVANDDLKWEANQTLNLGIDMGFFDQRLIISPEFYVNKSSDLLLKATLPLSSGYESMYRNIGSTQNKGFDLAINSVNIKTRDFQWSTTLNVSHNQNEILELSGEDSYLSQSGWAGTGSKSDYIVSVGMPVGQMYGYKTVGLYQVDDFELNADGSFQFDDNGKYILKEGVVGRTNVDVEPGYWKFAEAEGAVDGTIDDNDRQVIGDANPLFYGGLNNTFVYKNFDLSVFMNFSVGNDILNATKLYSCLYGWSRKNTLALADSNNRWVTVDETGAQITDPATMNAINSGKTVASWEDMENGDMEVHSWGVEDGSFLRISNITLGYTLPKAWTKKIHVKSLRVYGTVNNLACFTNYTGFDPEVSTRNSTGLTPGVDWGASPRSTSYIFGLSLTL